MLERRRYVVRLYGKGGHLTGILEDARTGAENPFRNARELVSLLCKAGLPSPQSMPPRGGTCTTDLRLGAPQTKRGVNKR
jgi:hypothetical protein